MKKTIYSCILAVLLIAGCGKKSGPEQSRGGGKSMQFPVEVAVVETRPVVYSVSAVGSVEAFETVQVTARVAGVIERIRFAEGRSVRSGDILADIEPERYKLSLDAAKAALEKAEAAKADAEAGLTRRESVGKATPGLIPGEELETWRTKTRAAAADLAMARIAADQAALNLRDALVKAPVGGIIQSRTAQTGQYVQPGAVLATLVRRDPLLLRFRVTEQDAPRLRVGQRAQFTVRNDDAVYTATINHVAAAADERSRMANVTAEVRDTRSAALRPGAFAEVRIPIGDSKLMPVIPQTAIRPSERGFLAYVVEGAVARERVLRIGLRTEDGQVEVLSGLTAGEKLVVRGAEALRDGAAVRSGNKKGGSRSAEGRRDK